MKIRDMWCEDVFIKASQVGGGVLCTFDNPHPDKFIQSLDTAFLLEHMDWEEIAQHFGENLGAQLFQYLSHGQLMQVKQDLEEHMGGFND